MRCTAAICIAAMWLCGAPIARADDIEIPELSLQPVYMSDAPTESIAKGEPPAERVHAPLRVTLGDWYSPQYHGIDNTQGNTVVLRTYIPWEVEGVNQITRVHVPFETSSPGTISQSDVSDTPAGPNGLGDVEVYNVSLIKTPAGEFSIGPVFTIPTGSKSGVGKGQWTIGPAFGYESRHGNWRTGFFSQGYFSFAGANDTDSVEKYKVQPILEMSLTRGWVIGSSDMNLEYDFVKQKFTNIPLGLSVGRTFEMGGRRMFLVGQTEYNFADLDGTSAWTFRLTWEYWSR